MSFKDAEAGNYDETCYFFKTMIAAEFRRHNYVKVKIADNKNLEKFEELASGEGDIYAYKQSLKLLSNCLEDYHGRKAVILIDEYDVPLQKSLLCNYYNDMINFIRPLLGSALKDNPHLQFSVITGCLRVSRESIFTGLNNLDIVSILTKNYSEYFGFTQDEMDVLLRHYDLEGKRQIVRDWYDGYLFGNTEVYNPWSSINVVKSWLADINEFPKPYWANTSGNDIVCKLIDVADDDVRADIETLTAGGTISKAAHEDITYDEMDKSSDSFWNFLFFTGYLKKVGEGRQDENGNMTIDLSIPNIELKYIYVTKIQEWFKEKISRKDFSKFYEAILGGNAEVVQDELSKFLLDTISVWDYHENFYHGVMLGFLSGLRNYYVKSNREAGRGRCDIVLRHASGRGKAVIFELKCTKNMREIEKKCEEALEQIKNGMYVNELESECYNEVVAYGAAFCKKSCEVRKFEHYRQALPSPGY